MKQYIEHIYRRPAVWFAVLAAILYSSWPWAFVLNPYVATHSLASQLQTAGQPYSWVFIAGDSLTGAVLLWTAVLQYRLFKTGGRMTRWVMAGYVAFGILTAVAALVPLDCDPQTRSCGAIINDPYILVHGFASIVSVLALLGSVVALCLFSYKHNAAPLVRQTFVAILSCWFLFGALSVVQLWWHPGGNGSQDYFITLCSVSAVAVVAAVEYLHNSHKDPAIESAPGDLIPVPILAEE